MVSRLKLAAPSRPSLPYRVVTGFTGVNELDLSSFVGELMGSKLLDGVMASLSGLRSLNLVDNKMDHYRMRLELIAWAPSLTGLTYLSMANTNVLNYELAVLAPFLSSLTHLDLNECAELI
jgi:hypothetical protein